MRILVTGGAGFVGAHLCRRLLADGHDVICLDNFSTSHRNNIAELLANPKFSLMEQDVETPVQQLQVDQIYNLACPASPPHYQHDPIKTVKTAFLGVLNMLELARQNDATILQASTSEVYGDPECAVQSETYRGCVSCTGPRACYDEGKRVGETLMFDYNRKYGTKIRVIRIFNTYGPWMHPYDGRVVSNFILQALKGVDITVYGTGEQTRSFQYVADLVEGMVRMMNNSTGFIGPVNLGNPGEFTMKQLADLVIEMTNSKSKLVYLPLPQDDPTKRCPDIRVAGQQLGGWSPSVTLREGLAKTIPYFASLDLSQYTPPTTTFNTYNPSPAAASAPAS